MDWADWLNICILRVMNINWSYQNLLFWAGIVWRRLSGNQIVRCFKLKKLKNCMSYQVDILLPLELQKISYYFGLCWKILLASQFSGFFTFDLFDLLILVPGVHCYIILVLINTYHLLVIQILGLKAEDNCFFLFRFHWQKLLEKLLG